MDAVEFDEMKSEVRVLNARLVEHNHADREQFSKIATTLTLIDQRVVELEGKNDNIQRWLILLFVLVLAFLPAMWLITKAAVTETLIEHDVIEIRAPRTAKASAL